MRINVKWLVCEGGGGECNCITIPFNDRMNSLMAIALRILIPHIYLHYFIFTFLIDFYITPFYVQFNNRKAVQC